MGAIRTFTKRARWTDPEVAMLSTAYAITPRGQLAAMFSHRKIRAVESKANALGLARPSKPGRTPAQVLEAKKRDMAARRAADPERSRSYQRANHAKNKDARNLTLREWNRAHFFRSRANKVDATAFDLASIWRRQRGRCALTGRRLDRTAQLDHIVARARGGDDSKGNLRWLCKEANLARRELSDAEFTALCREVMRWIGQQIEAATSAQLPDHAREAAA